MVTWAMTTDAKGFYESLGYKVVGEGWFGQEDPTWDGGLLPICVVSIFASYFSHASIPRHYLVFIVTGDVRDSLTKVLHAR